MRGCCVAVHSPETIMGLFRRFASDDRPTRSSPHRSRASRPAPQAGTRTSPVYWAEALERRVLLAAVPITVNIAEILQLRNPDTPPRGDGDFYARVTIGNAAPQVSTDFDDTHEGVVVTPNWHFTEILDPVDFPGGLIPIKIELGDDDDLPFDDNGVVDINPTAGETAFTFDYDPAAGVRSEFTSGADAGAGSARLFSEASVAGKVVPRVTGFGKFDGPAATTATAAPRASSRRSWHGRWSRRSPASSRSTARTSATATTASTSNSTASPSSRPATRSRTRPGSPRGRSSLT